MSVVQMVTATQGGLRGMDYFMNSNSLPNSPSIRAVEEIGDLKLWGILFLFGAAALIVGMSGGWVFGIFVGHAVLFGSYTVLGGLLLSSVAKEDLFLAIAGTVCLAGGLILCLIRLECRRHFWYFLRFIGSLVLVFGGAWLASHGLGSDFRSATGVVAAGILQITLLLGTAVLVLRDHEEAT